MSNLNLVGVLEGLLFLNGEDGLSLEKAKDILEIDDIKLQNLLEELNTKYQCPNSG